MSKAHHAPLGGDYAGSPHKTGEPDDVGNADAASIPVEMIRARYGEYKVLVDGRTVVDGGPLVILGLMPSAAKIVARVREQLTGRRER